MTTGMWVWKADEIVVTEETLNEFIGFLETTATFRVYLWINRKLPIETYNQLISATQAKIPSVEFFALHGDASQAASISGREDLISVVRYVHTYNTKFPGAKFVGMQVDIEPYSLPQWQTDKELIGIGWIDAIETFASTVKMLNPEMKTSAALPFWIDTVSAYGSSIYPRIAVTLDETVLMSYRDTPSEVLRISTNVLNTAKRYNHAVYLGLETKDIQPAHTTFFGKTYQDVRDAVVKLSLETGHRNLEGVVVHDYPSYKKLYDRNNIVE